MTEFAISHYRVLEVLGRGGMGVVYKAEDTRLGRPVALKFLQERFARQEAFLERFRREARAVSSLNHPHICTIYEVDEQDGQAFIAMELIEGRGLADIIHNDGPVPVEAMIEFALQLADGLEMAHSKGIVHRDIKPANIYVTQRGQTKILDFGLAKQLEVEAATPGEGLAVGNTRPDGLTRAGGVVGTISYMSPEQACGAAADARSDIFSLGAVLYEMATGRQAFPGATTAIVFDAILNRMPATPSLVNSKVPARLDDIILKALRKDFETRYQRTSDLWDDLKQLRREFHAGGSHPTLPVRPTAQESIAVLPFLDISAEHDQEYFCEGIAEELVNALANVEGLRVASRTSAARLKKQDVDVPDIGRKLQVSTVLEGSVRKAGNQLRITVKLVDVSNGYNLWSERYDRKIEDVFAIQDEIAASIVDRLKIQLSSGSAPLVRRYTDNMEAYHLYLKGRFYWDKRYDVGVQKGMEYFQQAIDKDPRYALAYAGLADSYSVLSTYNFLSPGDGYGRAKLAALKALELDSTLAEANTSVGYIRLFHDWDWTATEAAMRRAIRINPNYAVAHYWYATHLAAQKQFGEAEEYSRKALDLEPLSPIVSTIVGWTQLLERRYDLAIVQFEHALEIEPRSSFAQCFLAIAYAQGSQFDQAIVLMERAIEGTRGSCLMNQGLAIVYAKAGRAVEARALLDGLKTRGDSQYFSPFYAATTCSLLNDVDRAIEYLERGYRERDGAMVYLNTFPLLDNVRNDARFQELVRRMNFKGA